MTTDAVRDRLLSLARGRGVLPTREVAGAGLHRDQLTRLVREGALERVGRGLYQLPDAEVTEHPLLSKNGGRRLSGAMKSASWDALER